MIINVERFGKSYTFDAPEPGEFRDRESEESDTEGVGYDTGVPKIQSEDKPGLCLVDAVEAVGNLLRCVFPEMEGHHLGIMCDHPDDGCPADDEEPGESPEGGIDLR